MRPPFRVGQLVTTDYYAGSRMASIKRTVTRVEQAKTKSGWVVSTTGLRGGPVLALDAGWYKCADCGWVGMCGCSVSPEAITQPASSEGR